MNSGILAALGAFVLWGFLPVYWKSVDQTPATEILSHRMVWSLLFILVLLLFRTQWSWITKARTQPKVLLNAFGCSLLLGSNWMIYIWSVNAGYIVEASLGYYINPLLNVVLGVFFLQERLRPWQWFAITVAATGVLYLTLSYGQVPWIAIGLALTFGFYGLLRKQSQLESMEGLALESSFLTLPAFLYLLYLGYQGSGSFGNLSISHDLLLAGTGIATALPLLLFAYSARRISLTALGLLQYIGPSIQLALGVWIYNEPFDQQRIVGFSIIWSALLIYTLEGIYRRRAHRVKLEKPTGVVNNRGEIKKIET
ncbi:EamA family transporter RarD [Motiliproteus sp. MSK22-1]|uniref:EamA family transporter RarD n=1 Tax=Motiliproteus sp. MSK22-1 TaxID=1897630 RepID=UPI0009760C67|nr:EamA family transporter RarD [Motiliproteus sp. MSK22-1]OMH36560.1 transporter [Motiliproteus sp. MSK22-1]